MTESPIFRHLALDTSVWKNHEVLRPTYLPSQLAHREGETGVLARALAPLLHEDAPGDLLVTGPAASGKTALVRHVGAELTAASEEVGAPIRVLVGDGEVGTTNRLMVRLANQLSPRWEDNVPLTGRPLAVALALLRKWIAADARPVLVVLDHADLLDEPERVAGALAQLRGDPQVRATFVILARSDRPEIAGQLDTRRFRLDRLAANHVVDILASRADSAFQEGAVSRETLAHLAAAAGHDLRVGIGALRHMANRADQEARKLLEPAWVDEAVDAVRIEALRDAWLTLPIQHHAVLQTILEATESGTKPISSGDIQRAHREKLRGSEGPGGRMISNVIRAMHNSGLIQAPINNRGRGGRTRNVTVHHAALLQAWINEASQR